MDGIRSKVFDGIDNILQPVVQVVIQGCVHRAIRRTQRFHELHVEIGRYLKLQLRIDDYGPFGGFSLHLAGCQDWTARQECHCGDQRAVLEKLTAINFFRHNDFPLFCS